MAQGIGIVVVLPALRSHQNHGPEQGRQVVHDVGPAAVIPHLPDHPRYDLGRLKSLPKKHRAGITGQSLGTGFNAQGPVEPWRDRLSRFTHAYVLSCR